MSQKKKTTAQSKRPRKAPSNQTGGTAWGKKVAAAISGKMQSADMKKLILLNFPYIIAFYMVEKAAWLYRHCNGDTIVDRLMVLFMNFGLAYKSYLPSVHPFDLLVGLIGAAALKAVIYFKGKNAKKYRQGEEYGSARWGNAKDIEPFVDPVFENNVLLTQTERLMMSGRPKHPKYARNKNVIVIGGSGSGKTRFFVKPNLMQMPEKVSYVCTDPKGTIIIECGKMLSDAGYKIKVLNTINFKKSMHYNPFHYIRSEKDILKLVNTIIANTKGDGEKSGEDFWVKAERLLYCALIGYIYYEAPEEEQNFSTLLEFINASEAREDDEEFKNPVDELFEDLEKAKPEHFAVRQYKKYKLAAGVVCSKRLLNQAVGKSLRTHNLKPKKGAQVMRKNEKITALYERLSRDDFGKDDDQQRESNSISNQKSMLMEYATRNGFGNCQYYVDDGYSGTNSDRPAFQELLDDIREGKVATVITKDQSRLGRNHIETGTYMEIFFPEHGVRYIAINDGYDSNEQSQMDIAPFRNIINEMYAKDTSRKIKSALRTRKKSGKYISSGAPFGYQKDPADHNHLVIDPNTAPVVEYIYSMAEEGLGLHRIAKRLHDEKVLKPCYYKKEMFGRFIDDEKMYDWDSAYISQVLHSPVYAGHIIYEAKPTVSMKSKKRRYIPFEERAIVPNTHEAIIPQDRWENVQRILYSRSSSFMCDKTDYDNIFKGIVRCADCGRTMLVKVEHRRKRNSVLDQTFYCCSTYRKYGAKACDSHNLEARVLHEAVFADIQAHAKAAVSNREALVKKIANQMHLRVSSGRAQHKRDLKQCKVRIAEIEDLYAKLYEDVSKGLLPEKRFQMLADRYDKEQAELTEKIEQYEREGRAEHDQLDKIQDFIDEVSKYAGITELNYKILHQLIDKILVSRAEKVDGEYVQKIQIFYRFIGPLDAIE